MSSALVVGSPLIAQVVKFDLGLIWICTGKAFDGQKYLSYGKAISEHNSGKAILELQNTYFGIQHTSSQIGC